MSLKSMPPELQEILQRDGFVIFISGPKEKGKTNLALLLSEIAFLMGWRKEIATNIWTESYFITQIANYPDLEAWLMKGHKKVYTLDELGKHAKKMRFMTDKNQMLMDIVQLVRHFDAGLIGCAPSEVFVDNNFLNTDILDAKIKKITQDRAKIIDYLNHETYYWNNIPVTSIHYNSKDIANFSMKREKASPDLQLCCQVAEAAKGWRPDLATMEKIGQPFGLNAEETKRELIKHLQHSQNTSYSRGR